jgi:hypothetical protein
MYELTEREFIHECWCDTQNKISNVCNCIVGYPLEVIQDQQSRIDGLVKALEELEKYSAISTVAPIVYINAKINEALEKHKKNKEGGE